MKKIIYPKIELDGVKAVLIDLDDTLYPYHENNNRALRAAYAFSRHELQIGFAAFLDEFQKVFDARYEELGSVPSAHSRFFVFERVLLNHHLSRAWTKAFEMEKIFWRHFMKRMRPDKTARQFLKECQKRNLPVCLVTDLFADIQIKKLQKLRLTPYIDMIVSNDDAGVDKPHPNIFKLALKRLNLKPDDVIMVGDNPKNDIAGAEALGIKAYQVFPPKKK